MYNKELECMIDASKAASKIIADFFGNNLKSTEKSTNSDLVTAADLESEKIITNKLSKDFPNYSIHSEEEGFTDKNSEYTFYVDPLDGSHNFTMDIPNFSISIALLYGNKAVAGTILNPITGQLYYAQENKGAFLNDRQIKTSSTQDIEKSVISYIAAYDRNRNVSSEIIKQLNKHKIKRDITNWSCAQDYGLLASAKIEGIICNDNEIHDNAAGRIIIREAGGVITNFKGIPCTDDTNTSFIAANNEFTANFLVKVFQDTMKEVLMPI